MTKNAEAFLDEVPSQSEIRQRLAVNLAERTALRTLLRLSERRDAVRRNAGPQLQASQGAQK